MVIRLKDKNFRYKSIFLIQTYSVYFLIFILRYISFDLFKIKELNITIIAKSILVIINIILLMLSFAGIHIINYLSKGTKKLPTKLQKCELDNEINIMFFMTYILPLITLEINNIREIFIFFVIMGIFVAFTFNTNLWYTNPLLLFWKYKIYKVKINGQEKVGISKDKIICNDVVEYIDSFGGENIIFMKKRVK